MCVAFLTFPVWLSCFYYSSCTFVAFLFCPVNLSPFSFLSCKFVACPVGLSTPRFGREEAWSILVGSKKGECSRGAPNCSQLLPRCSQVLPSAPKCSQVLPKSAPKKCSQPWEQAHKSVEQHEVENQNVTNRPINGATLCGGSRHVTMHVFTLESRGWGAEYACKVMTSSNLEPQQFATTKEDESRDT